jgi:hypothetical protein
VHVHGTCHLILAFDIGYSIDLTAAEPRLISPQGRVKLRDRRRAPSAVTLTTQPLRTRHEASPVKLGRWATEPEVDLVLYEFGAVSVTFRVTIDDPLERLVQLSWVRYDNEELEEEARRHVRQSLERLGDTVHHPHVSETAEDYAVFALNVESLTSSSEAPDVHEQLAELWTNHAQTVARILRGETKPLSEQEVADALAQRTSYGPDDAALVDWSAAILVGDDMSDEHAVLEFALVELVELRHLDAQLDSALDNAHNVIAHRPSIYESFFGATDRQLNRLARLQVDYAILLQEATNPQKLLGDQYLADLYQNAFARYHLQAWSQTIDGKVKVLDGIYRKLADHANTQRMETLEWIIIILIAVSILVYFLPHP